MANVDNLRRKALVEKLLKEEQGLIQDLKKKGVNKALLSKEELYTLKTIRVLERHHEDYDFFYEKNPNFKNGWSVSIKKPDGNITSLKGPVSLKDALEFFELQTKHNLKEEVKPNINKDFVLKLDTEERFFAAVAIIFKGNKILLGKSLSEDDRFGKLVFPGGHIEKDESPYMAAKREAKEETGIAAKCRPLPIIEDVPEKEIEGKEGRKIAFVICDYVGGEIKPNEEFEWLKWIPLKNINWEEVYPQNVKILQALLNKRKTNLQEDLAGFAFLIKDVEATDIYGKKWLLKKGTRVTDESNGWDHFWRTKGTTFGEKEISDKDIDGFHI